MRHMFSWWRAVSLAVLRPARRSKGIASPVMPDMLRRTATRMFQKSQKRCVVLYLKEALSILSISRKRALVMRDSTFARNGSRQDDSASNLRSTDGDCVPDKKIVSLDQADVAGDEAACRQQHHISRHHLESIPRHSSLRAPGNPAAVELLFFPTSQTTSLQSVTRTG